MSDPDRTDGSSVAEENEIFTDQVDENETVTATSYVPQSQYNKWQNEAELRDQSISTLISSMVEMGLNDIDLEESPSEIVELREKLRQVRSDRNRLQEQLQVQEQQDYQVGLGRIKELIINNPGLDRREIINFVNENTISFTDGYIESLESSEFQKLNGEWYPPETMGDFP